MTKFVNYAENIRATGANHGVAFAEEVARCVRVIAAARGLMLVNDEWCARAVLAHLFKQMTVQDLAREGVTYHRVLVAMRVLGYLEEPPAAPA